MIISKNHQKARQTMSDFDLEMFIKNIHKWHHPHFYKQKNNQESMLPSGEFSDVFKDGHTYRRAYIDEKTGEEVHVVKCGMFRRFSYNEFLPEASKAAKQYSKEYEAKFGADDEN